MVIVFALLALTVIVAANWYLWRRLFHDTTRAPGRARRGGAALIAGGWVLAIGALVAERTGAPFWLQRVLAWPGFLWLALSIYLLLAVIVGEAVRPLLRRILQRRAATAETPAPQPRPQPQPQPGQKPLPVGAPEHRQPPSDRPGPSGPEPAAPPPDRPTPSEPEPDPSRSDRSGSGLSGSGLSGSGLSRSGLSAPGLSRSGPSRSGLSAPDPSGSDPSRSGPSGSGLSASDPSGSGLSGSDPSASDSSGSGRSGSGETVPAGPGAAGPRSERSGAAGPGADKAPEGVVGGPSRRLFVSRVVGGAAAAAAVGTVGYGTYGVLRGPRVKRVTVPLAKLPRAAHGYRIAVVSDIHLSPVLGRGFARRVVDTINSTQPDLIAVVGDLVDGSVKDLGPAAAPLAQLKARHGSFFVTGNHEYFSGAEQWVEEVRRLGLTPLENARTELPWFDVAGVNDIAGESDGQGPDFTRALGDRDTTRACVLLAHQPVQIHDAVSHGVDLQLSGHTHGGQLWPGNLIAAAANPTVAGLERYGDTQLYVSRGAGAWGPPTRVGAPSDITVIQLASTRT
ncbi:metallophosphoesterase [Streptomyces sp. NPDC020951]|uniref:metallophosphoesterase n=1 Tax=Streptomyces sp. NPDC020951 TaxID=3365104 RepID=UPI0037893B6B